MEAEDGAASVDDVGISVGVAGVVGDEGPGSSMDGSTMALS